MGEKGAPGRARGEPAGIIYGHIWTYMVIYGHIWPYMAIYGHIWPYMAIYGHIRPYMAIYGHIWAYMAIYGDIWPHSWTPSDLLRDQSKSDLGTMIERSGTKNYIGFIYQTSQMDLWITLYD